MNPTSNLKHVLARTLSQRPWVGKVVFAVLVLTAFQAMASLATAQPAQGFDPSIRLAQNELPNKLPGFVPGNPVAQQPNGQEKPKAIEMGPAPKPFEPFGPFRPRMTSLGDGPLGTTPHPTPETIKKFNQFIPRVVDPENVIDLVEGRARLLILAETPKRVQVADETYVSYNILSPKEITIIGAKVGTTVLNLWFPDPNEAGKEVILSYMVRVIPDPEKKIRLERTYKALEMEINKTFPDSVIHLKLVGDKLMVTGQARDILEGSAILRILKANAPQDKEKSVAPIENLNVSFRQGDMTNLTGTPGLEDFQNSGGPNVINLLRVPGEQQVMLKVTVAEVSRTAARSIGLNFSATNNNGIQFLANNTGGILGAAAAAGAGGANLPIVLDNGQIRLALQALRSYSYARSLAEPNLVAINGKPANFQAGGQFPVPVVTGFTGAGLQGVNFVPFGVQLSFTPFITDKDRIRLVVQANVSTRDVSIGSNFGIGAGAGAGGAGGAFVPGLNTRNFNSTVELREGQTLAVAGLIQNNIGADSARIPFIGDLPFLGQFTGVSKTSAGESELVILITPELVHPMEPKEIPPLPGSDLFEPSDLEFYVHGRIESRREYDFRSPVMNDWARLRNYQRCEQNYIFGPHGFSQMP